MFCTESTPLLLAALPRHGSTMSSPITIPMTTTMKITTTSATTRTKDSRTTTADLDRRLPYLLRQFRTDPAQVAPQVCALCDKYHPAANRIAMVHKYHMLPLLVPYLVHASDANANLNDRRPWQTYLLVTLTNMSVPTANKVVMLYGTESAALLRGLERVLVSNDKDHNDNARLAAICLHNLLRLPGSVAPVLERHGPTLLPALAHLLLRASHNTNNDSLVWACALWERVTTTRYAVRWLEDQHDDQVVRQLKNVPFASSRPTGLWSAPEYAAQTLRNVQRWSLPTND